MWLNDGDFYWLAFHLKTLFLISHKQNASQLNPNVSFKLFNSWVWISSNFLKWRNWGKSVWPFGWWTTWPMMNSGPADRLKVLYENTVWVPMFTTWPFAHRLAVNSWIHMTSLCRFLQATPCSYCRIISCFCSESQLHCFLLCGVYLICM